MTSAAQHVVILYEHSLLGEGVARMLGAQDGLDIELVDVADSQATHHALAGAPDVVILERNPRVAALDLLRAAPQALFIDVGLDAGPTFAYRRDEVSAQPEGLLDVIRLRQRAAAPVRS